MVAVATRTPAKGWYKRLDWWRLEIPGATCEVGECDGGFRYIVTVMNGEARGLRDGPQEAALLAAEDAAIHLLNEGLQRLQTPAPHMRVVERVITVKECLYDPRTIAGECIIEELGVVTMQIRRNDRGYVVRMWQGDSWSVWGHATRISARRALMPARLVPIAEADNNPEQRQ